MKNRMFSREEVNGLISKVFIKLSDQIYLAFKNESMIPNKRKVFRNFMARIDSIRLRFELALKSEQGDVPGWVLVVLMTTGLVTGIWTVAQPRLSSILKNSLDNMNSIR